METERMLEAAAAGVLRASPHPYETIANGLSAALSDATTPPLTTIAQVPAWHLWSLLDEDAIVCGDSGTVTTWAARQIKIRANQRFSFSGTNCSMAAGLPYAIGAQCAFPHRQVVVTPVTGH